MSNNMDERLLDLLCDKALFGLDEAEEQELAGIEGREKSIKDTQSFELTAAAILMAETDLDDPLPPEIEARIVKAASLHFNAQRTSEEIHESIHDQPTRSFKWQNERPNRSFSEWVGWAVAAAACVVLAVNIYLTRGTSDVARNQNPTPTLEERLTPAQQRDRLIATATDITRAEWTKGNIKDVDSVSGEVVWSDSRQVGYMTFRGLPVNDVGKNEYQLWIFEDADLEAHPKDGGVFDVTSEGEVVIPIDAKLKALNPKAFAVTVEKPGGVVVSDRKKIAALAPVKPSQA